jgi:hypothetical protein
MDTAVELSPLNPNSLLPTGVRVTSNALFGSYDTHTLQIDSTGNNVTANIALGTRKVVTGSQFDLRLSATFGVFVGGNILQDNIAAGSDRLGYDIVGDSCDVATPLIADNHAQASLVGMIPRATDVAEKSCTVIRGFTTAFSWDFGLITMTGLPTDLDLIDCSFVNSKHAGVLAMRRGGMVEPAAVRYIGGSVVGATDASVCEVRHAFLPARASRQEISTASRCLRCNVLDMWNAFLRCVVVKTVRHCRRARRCRRWPRTPRRPAASRASRGSLTTRSRRSRRSAASSALSSR